MRLGQKIKYGIAFAVTMVMALVLPVQAVVVYNEKVPYDWVVTNSCTGEDIHLSGNIHMLNTETKDAKITVHSNFQDINGISTSGTIYHAQGNENIEFISEDGISGTYKGELTVKLVSQGSGDNFILHKVIHLIMNADGTTTISFDKDRIECQG